MDEAIEVSLERIRSVILSFSSAEFSTIDVLREYCGGFFSNAGTPAYYSFNAQFGKLLKRNEAELGITESLAGASAQDDNGRVTSTSFWRRTT